MKKSDLVSGMGLGTELVSSTVKLGRQAGLTDEDLHVLGTDEGKPFIQVMIDALKASLKVNLDSDFKVLVNYDERLEAKLARLREHGLTFANKDITTANFPALGQGGIVAMRLSLPWSESTMTTDAAEQFVEQFNLEVGDPYQLLDWLDQYWDRLQEQMTQGLYVAALAISWKDLDGNQRVISLNCRGSGRELLLCCASDDWYDYWRFIGFRNV